MPRALRADKTIGLCTGFSCRSRWRHGRYATLKSVAHRTCVQLRTVGPTQVTPVPGTTPGTENRTTNREWESLGKITRKLENEMQIAFVDRQLIDMGRKLDCVLAKAASSCYQLTVKSGSSSRHSFVSQFVVTLIAKYCQGVWLALTATIVYLVGSADPRWSMGRIHSAKPSSWNYYYIGIQ